MASCRRRKPHKSRIHWQKPRSENTQQEPKTCRDGAAAASVTLTRFALIGDKASPYVAAPPAGGKTYERDGVAGTKHPCKCGANSGELRL